MDEHINFEEIHKIPESDFQKYFFEWMRNDGVAKALQSKLRKDLFDTFNKTNLGRKIFSEYHKSRGMVLSPLVLATNALVAEFLYAQNCHFSLSVFSTEVPFRETLPDFEVKGYFRFSLDDINEIFDAITLNMDETLKKSISSQYLKKQIKENSSLLYCIFKNVFKRTIKEEKHKMNKNVQTDSEYNDVDISQSIKRNYFKNRKSKRKSPNSFFNNYFRYLNKYLIILSKKVKEISNNMENLESRGVNARNIQRMSMKNRRIENLNRSLQKISDNLKFLSNTRQKNKKVSLLLSSIDKMAVQLEKCACNFDKVSKNMMTEQQVNGAKTEKSYTEWVKEIKYSKNGRKFLIKVEASLQKNLEEEKHKLNRIFELKLENQKQLMKLKYKQRLVEQLKMNPAIVLEEKARELCDTIGCKLQELNSKHEHLMEKVNKATEACTAKSSDELFNLNKLNEDSNDDVAKVSNLNSNQKICEKNADDTTLIIDEILSKSIVYPERNIDHIVLDAKLRVQELENESNQLEHSFQEYLRKQRQKKYRLEADISTIWDKYIFEKNKLNLNSKYCQRYEIPADIDQSATHTDSNDCFKNPTNSILLQKTFQNLCPAARKDHIEFENPFRSLQKNIFMRQLFRTSEINIDTEKDDEKFKQRNVPTLGTVTEIITSPVSENNNSDSLEPNNSDKHHNQCEIEKDAIHINNEELSARKDSEVAEMKTD